jgi:D-threo-aldose 1-dehydrogenase
LDTAWDVGIRYFDTAPHYGLGTSERRLGDALAIRARNDFVISTKVGRLLIPNPKPSAFDVQAGHAVAGELVRQRDYSRDGIRRSLEGSLERLKMDHVDILYLHDPEEHMEQSLREAVPEMVRMRDEGLVSAIGIGMNYVSPLQRFVVESDIDIVLVAGRWTLIDREAAELIRICEARGVGVVAAAPFNSGLLSTPWPADSAKFDYAPASQAVVQRARRLALICRSHGYELPHAAIQFPIQRRSVACVLAGFGSAHEVRAAAAWMTQPLPGTLWSEIDEVANGAS